MFLILWHQSEWNLQACKHVSYSNGKLDNLKKVIATSADDYSNIVSAVILLQDWRMPSEQVSTLRAFSSLAAMSLQILDCLSGQH